MTEGTYKIKKTTIAFLAVIVLVNALWFYKVYWIDEPKPYVDSAYTGSFIAEAPLQPLPIKESDKPKVDTLEVENRIFELMNEAREKEKIPVLKRNRFLDEMARDYSNEIIETGRYAHINEGGEDLHDRLKHSKLFFSTATEDLGGSYYEENKDMAKELVDGWLSSPSHSSSILDYDYLWNNVGIGVKCGEVTESEEQVVLCYATVELVGFRREYSDRLWSEYSVFLPILEKGSGIDYKPDVRIDFTSTEAVDIYVVPDYEQFNKVVKDESFSSIVRKNGIKEYHERMVVEPGYGVIINAFRTRSDLNYTLIVSDVNNVD